MKTVVRSLVTQESWLVNLSWVHLAEAAVGRVAVKESSLPKTTLPCSLPQQLAPPRPLPCVHQPMMPYRVS